MQSFIYEKDPNKVVPVQKPLPKPLSSSVNPFYQFISNMKPSNLTLPIQTPLIVQKAPSFQVPSVPSIPSQRKSSAELSDPRKALPYNRVTANRLNANSQTFLASKTPQNNQLREKRSRSRDNKISKDRENSENQFGKQKHHDFYRKTKLCPLYDKGQCKKHSSQCNFAHGFKELKCFKTKICYAFQRGQCNKPTEQCKYAHGEKQLRPANNDIEPLKNTSVHRERKQTSHERQKKHHKDRNSESVNHYERRDKNSSQRTEERSRDHKKQKFEDAHDPLSSKKNLPLSKEYEKFLYGDSNTKVSPSESNFLLNNKDSMYLLPNSSPNASKVPYSMESYSIDLGRPFESYPRSAVSLSYPEIKRPYKDLLRQKDGYRQQPPVVPFYEKPSIDFHKQSYPYLNQNQTFVEKTYHPEMSYPGNFGYGKPDSVSPYTPPNVSLYHHPADIGRDFSQNPYKHTNQGGFKEQPYNNGPKNDDFSDSVYRRSSSGYPQVKSVRRPQDFYRNEPLYSGSEYRKNEFGQSVSGYRNDFSGNGAYNAYPGTDKSMGQVGKGLPAYPVRSFDEKGRYQGFSNKTQK